MDSARVLKVLGSVFFFLKKIRGSESYLLSNSENSERLKIFGNFYCVVTNQNKVQYTRTNPKNKTTDAVCGHGLVFSRLIDFSL